MKLGIIDWGIGGVGLLQKIREKSDVDVIYFSDTGYTPYGKVPKEELKNRLNRVIDFLQCNECEWIAVACNAASTVLPMDQNCFGVIQPALEMIREMKLSQVGVAGGKRTIESGIYKRELEKSGIKVQQQIAQPLSARIEAGDLHSEDLKKEIAEIFESLKGEKYILLACTHYPAIAGQITAFLPDAVLLDPIEKMSSQILQRLPEKAGKRSVKWITSGNIHGMLHALQTVYGINANTIERRML